MAWTNEQQLAINKDGSNIIVSAGAGSGKTAVLSTRVIEKLKKGIHINELLILTFTNAAAAEMKERIKKNIKRENLLEELDLLDSSYITTFDSFALSIVKKYHYLLNIPKNLSITDATIINVKKRQILTEIMEEYYKNPSELFTKWITTYCVKDDESLKEELLKLANTLEIKTNLYEFLDTYIEKNYNQEKTNELLHAYHQILNEKIEEVQEEIEINQSSFETDYLNKLKESIAPLKSESELNNLIAKILIAKIPAVPRGSEEEVKNAKEKINKKLKELKEMCIYGYQDEIKEDYQNTKEAIQMTLEILKKYFVILERYKHQNHIFDFSDIAKYSLKLITEEKSIQTELKNTFKEIMVDEYQDTSDIQEEFIQLISNHNLYMVGDIKQSIYRFRNANPYIFKNKYDQYSKNIGGIKIDLLKNFRSRQEVLDNINVIFNKIMDDKIGSAEYEETHQMVFGNTTYQIEGKTNQDYNMEIIEYDIDSKQFSKEEIEIFTIAKDIKEKVTHHYQIFDKDKLLLRPAEYQDFVIIMDRNTTFELTKKIFEYEGIPLSLYKDEDLNSSNDIYIIKNIIKLLIHMKERNYNKDYLYAFTSIARSFLYRLTDQEIYDIVENKNTFNTPIYKDLKPIANFLNTLSIEEVILEIIKKTNLYQKLITVGNVKESIIRMEKILELSNNITNINYDIYDFHDYLEELLKKDELIKFNMGSSSSNSVKIMNIHKSKGLEFPICYFCGLYKSFSKEDLKGDFLYVQDLPIYTPVLKEGMKETFLKLVMKEKVKKDDISEKLRIFYVALTRAKEKMILLIPKKETTSNSKKPNGVIKDTIRLKYNSIADMLYSIKKELIFYEKELDINSIHLTKDYLLPKEKSKEIKEGDKIKVTPLNIQLEIKETKIFSKKINELIDKETKRNIDLGIKVHQIIEYIDFHNFKEDLIEDLFIRNLIKKFLQSPLLANLEKAKIYQEYEFLYEEDSIEYHGIIDLLLVYEDHIDIIDYKLNNIVDENYEKQLNGYKKYISKISKKDVHAYLFSILTQEIKEI